MNKPVFKEEFTKIVTECRPSDFNDKSFNKVSYYSVTQQEIELFELGAVIE